MTIESAIPVAHDRLRRELSARQVQMIAIAGTIGTGLFLGEFRLACLALADPCRYWTFLGPRRASECPDMLWPRRIHCLRHTSPVG